MKSLLLSVCLLLALVTTATAHPRGGGGYNNGGGTHSHGPRTYGGEHSHIDRPPSFNFYYSPYSPYAYPPSVYGYEYFWNGYYWSIRPRYR